jgi:hypothetical protein
MSRFLAEKSSISISLFGRQMYESRTTLQFVTELSKECVSFSGLEGLNGNVTEVILWRSTVTCESYV